MWNNLRSDVYRLLHTKSFYIIAIIMLILYGMILTNSGVQSNSTFAMFERTSNTFAEYLYYLPKSGLFVFLVLLCIGLFTTDEYMSGFEKNVYPLYIRKWTLVIERYFFSFLVIAVFFLLLFLEAFIIQGISPLEFGSIRLLDYILYTGMQLLMLNVIASLVMMLAHFTKSRVLVVLLSVSYGLQLLYMTLAMLCNFMFKSIEILDYSMYILSGKLAYTFSVDGYATAFIVLIGMTLLYNGISYFILKKKDL